MKPERKLALLARIDLIRGWFGARAVGAVAVEMRELERRGYVEGCKRNGGVYYQRVHNPEVRR